MKKLLLVGLFLVVSFSCWHLRDIIPKWIPPKKRCSRSSSRPTSTVRIISSTQKAWPQASTRILPFFSEGGGDQEISHRHLD